MKITTILIGLIGCILVAQVNPGLYPHVLGMYILALFIDFGIWLFND